MWKNCAALGTWMIGLRLNLSLQNTMSCVEKLVTKICSISSSFGNNQELRERNTCCSQDGHELKRANVILGCIRWNQDEDVLMCKEIYKVLGRPVLKYAVCASYSCSRKMCRKMQKETKNRRPKKETKNRRPQEFGLLVQQRTLRWDRAAAKKCIESKP